MKIAIAAEKNNLSSEISSQGARTMFFLIFAENGELIEILENPFASNDSHVGPDVATMLIKMNVTTVIAGRFGTKFKKELERNHIKCIEQTGFATQVVNDIVA